MIVFEGLLLHLLFHYLSLFFLGEYPPVAQIDALHQMAGLVNVVELLV